MTGCTLAVVRGNGRDIVGLKTLLATWTPPSYFLSLKHFFYQCERLCFFTLKIVITQFNANWRFYIAIHVK